MSVSGLTPGQIAELTAAQIAALTQDDIASLTVPLLRHLTAAQFAEFSAVQLGFFTPAQITALAPAQIGALDPLVIAEFSIAQLGGLRPLQASLMTAAQMAGLPPATVAALSIPLLKHLPAAALQALDGLTLTQVRVFPPAVLAELTAAQFAALVAPNLSAFGALRLADLTPQQAATLTSQQANGLTAGKLEALSADAVGALSSAVLGSLRQALTQALTADQLNGMGGAALSALNPEFITATQVGSLTAAAVASLSTSAFDALLGGALSALSTSAIAGLTIADLSSLTTAQLSSFTAAQLAAMTSAQAAIVLNTDPVMQDLRAHESNGALSYAGALAVLQDAANGGMTQTKFADLTSIAGSLDSGAIGASAYVAQIFNDVVTGNSANAWWTGGAASPLDLGDLTSSSTQNQADLLIDKWLLGTDLPSFSGDGFMAGDYQTYNLPLFSGQGPQFTDVNQGNVGDCFFLAALASTAKQDPSLIENMIQSNGNSSYSVEFQVGGQADFVTVNNQLPNFSSQWSNGSNMQFANSSTSMWVPLIEKGYAQLMEQADVPTYNVNANSYAAIDGGDSNGLTAVTGQSVIEFGVSQDTTESSAQSDLNTLQAALSAGNDVMLATNGTAIGNDWVSDHMYAVTGVDASAGTITLYNPWGVGATANGMDASFTASIPTLQTEDVTFEYAVGRPATA